MRSGRVKARTGIGIAWLCDGRLLHGMAVLGRWVIVSEARRWGAVPLDLDRSPQQGEARTYLVGSERYRNVQTLVEMCVLDRLTGFTNDVPTRNRGRL